MIESDDVDVVLVLTSMTAHGSLASAALRGGQARARREADGDIARGGRSARCSSRRNRPGISSARRTSCSRRPSAPSRHTSSNGDIGQLLLARARYGWSGPDWGRWFYERGGGALFDLGVYNVTSLCGLFGPARRVTAMAGVAIPERVVEGEAMRVQAEDNAHVLIDFGDARFASVTTRVHDAEVPLARDRAVRLARACCSCSATTGRPRATSCGATRRLVGAVPRERSGLAVDRGPAPPRRLHRAGPRAGHPAGARVPRARDHAGRAGGGRRRARAGDRERFPAPRASRLLQTSRTGAGSTTRARR